jgi:hypothetical protein
MLVYFTSIMVFKNVIDVSVIDEQFLVNMLKITVASWLPLHLLKKFKTYKYPNDYETIMQQHRRQRRQIIKQI